MFRLLSSKRSGFGFAYANGGAGGIGGSDASVIGSKEALAVVQAAGNTHQVEQLREDIVAEVRKSMAMVMAAAVAHITPARTRSTKAESTKDMVV